MERLYSRKRYLRETRKLEKYKELSRRIRKEDKRRRSKMSRKEKRKAEGNRDGIESRSKGV